jgi:hypothetical protein
MLAYLFKKYNLQSAYCLQHIGMILLIFMMPAEVYCILDTIVQRTIDTFQEKKQDDLQWHVCMSKQQYVMQVSMFVKIYLASTFLKRRSLLTHVHNIHFDLTVLVDNCMRFFMSDFLPLQSVIEFTFVFMAEGVQALYRYIYAVVKLHKAYMFTLSNPKTFL